MDAQAKKKAFRAKLNAQKQEKQRIDSPLVRYNEHEQPVCRVCDVAIKSDSLWPAHQASRKHHEAIDKLKANAAVVNRTTNAKPQSAKELPKPKPESFRELKDKSDSSSNLPTKRSSTLPPNFFDNHEPKRQKNEKQSGKFDNTDSQNKDSVSAKTQVMADTSSTGLEAKQVKGALPQGFFDDKDADLRARGITPIKPDVKDEYKEFEKLIREDLQQIDNRLEEEEFDAAEMIEEEETVEQRSYVERVEMLRRKKLELRASRSAAGAKDTKVTSKKSSHESSSSDDEDEDDDNFKVDWRAKHL